MPIIKNFAGKMPEAISQPNVFIQGAAPELLPWGLILLDTGYSKDLAMNQYLRAAIGIPKGDNVALKIVLPTAELVVKQALSRIDTDERNPSLTALKVERDAMLCVDQKLEYRDSSYNVISIGFARDLNQMLLVKNNKALGVIDHSHASAYKKSGGPAVLLPEITLCKDAQAPAFHKELVVEWSGHQPFVKTTFARAEKAPATMPVLWDTGADINTCPASLWDVLKGKPARLMGQNAFILDELIGLCTDDTQLIFKDVPFFDHDSLTIGAPILSAFPELGLGPKFTVLLP